MTIRKRLERLEAIAPSDADIPTIIINIVTRNPDGEIVSSPTIAKIPTAGDWIELTRDETETDEAFLARVDGAKLTALKRLTYPPKCGLIREAKGDI